MKKILIVGAHTAVARALVECLRERDVDAELVRATTTEFVADELTLLDEASIKGADLAVLTLGGTFARGIGEGLRKLNKPILDMAGVFGPGDSIRPVFGGLDPRAHEALQPGAVASVPLGLTVPMASAIECLAPFLPRRASITALESAASYDQPGMDELAEQVRGVFTLTDVEPKVLPSTLAFNVAPAALAEDRLTQALKAAIRATPLAAIELSVSAALVPTFSVDSAHLELVVDGTPDPETVEGALGAARLLQLSKEQTGALEALGRDDALVSGLRVSPGRIAFWLHGDRLRIGSATPAALILEAWVG